MLKCASQFSVIDYAEVGSSVDRAMYVLDGWMFGDQITTRGDYE